MIVSGRNLSVKRLSITNRRLGELCIAICNSANQSFALRGSDFCGAADVNITKSPHVLYTFPFIKTETASPVGLSDGERARKILEQRKARPVKYWVNEKR